MKENEKCIVNDKEYYLNDILIELPYNQKSFTFEYQNETFEADSENAKEFCMNYSQDTYSQQVESIRDSMDGLMNFIVNTGDVVEHIKK